MVNSGGPSTDGNYILMSSFEILGKGWTTLENDYDKLQSDINSTTRNIKNKTL